LGIAACATVFTPAGPPLFIASLFFGGSATGVQVGTDVWRTNALAEPNELADRIIALHGMILSILRVTSSLRDAMVAVSTSIDSEWTNDHIREYLQQKSLEILEKRKVFGGTTSKSKCQTMAFGGIAATTVVIDGVETGATSVATTATTLSRTSRTAMRTMRLARGVGGALSAAILLMEANAIHSTLKSMKKGSPCEKAQRIRRILNHIQNDDDEESGGNTTLEEKEECFPSTQALDNECQAYLQALDELTLTPSFSSE